MCIMLITYLVFKKYVHKMLITLKVIHTHKVDKNLDLKAKK